MGSASKARITSWYVRSVLITSGLIIAAPGIIGAVSPEGLAGLYGLDAVMTHTESVLLRHRGVLLAIVGSLLLAAVMLRSLRIPAIIFGIISNISFVLLTVGYPASHADLARIAWVDVLLTVLLVSALIIHTRHQRS